MGSLLDLAMQSEPVDSSRGAIAADMSPRCFDSTQSDCLPPLTSAQEAASRTVLAILGAKPALERAWVNRFEDGACIVTLAVRSIGICELTIPAERVGKGNLDFYAELMACLTHDGTKEA